MSDIERLEPIIMLLDKKIDLVHDQVKLLREASIIQNERIAGLEKAVDMMYDTLSILTKEDTRDELSE